MILSAGEIYHKLIPQTAKGAKIQKSMEKTYGKKEAKKVYYASIVSGKVKGAEGKGGTGKLEKAKRTFARKHKRSTSTGFLTK